MDYPIMVFCLSCNKPFPITQQSRWTGLCPECQSKATATYLEAQQYLQEPKHTIAELKKLKRTLGYSSNPDDKETWTLVKLPNNKFHVVSSSGKLIKIDEIIEGKNNE